jgi:hypothetical protein
LLGHLLTSWFDDDAPSVATSLLQVARDVHYRFRITPRIAGYSRPMRAFFTRTVRSVRIVVRDGRIPRPLRWGAAMGLMPVPGPFDELVLLLVAGALWLFYRDRLSEAWERAGAANA